MNSLRNGTGNQFATTGNSIRGNRELITGNRNWLKIDPLVAMKHLLRAVALVSLLARRLKRPWPDLAKTVTI
jgi:hypothetical protein